MPVDGRGIIGDMVSGSRRAIAALVVASAMLAGACSLLREPEETPLVGAPAAAMVLIRAEPETLDRAVRIVFRYAGDEVTKELVTVPGERIVFEEAFMPGPYEIAVPELGCAVPFDGREGSSSEVRLSIDGERCTLEIGPGPANGQFAAVSARVEGDWSTAVIRFRSLDSPPNTVPPPENPDEDGNFITMGIAPGRYELVVVRGGVAGEPVTVDLDPGEEVSLDLR